MLLNKWGIDGPDGAILTERISLAGVFIGTTVYGVEVSLFMFCLSNLWTRVVKTRQEWMYLAYIWIVLLLGSVGNATYIEFAQMTWIDNREYPGGPSAYFVNQVTSAVPALNTASSIVLLWFANGLLLYRLRTVYYGTSKSGILVSVAVALFLASMGLGVYFLVALMIQGAPLRSNFGMSAGLPYLVISFALSLYFTSLILGRMIRTRRRLGKLLDTVGADYVSIPAMAMESGILTPVGMVLFFVPFVMGSPVQTLWLPLFWQVQSIAPLLVVLRTLRGLAWTEETAEMLVARGRQTTIRFVF